MRKLTAAYVAAATLGIAPALAADYFPYADYAWRPYIEWRSAYPWPYHSYAIAPGRHWGRGYRRGWSW